MILVLIKRSLVGLIVDQAAEACHLRGSFAVRGARLDIMIAPQIGIGDGSLQT